MATESDTPQGPINRHRLLIRHPTRAGVIGVDHGALPRVDTEDRHTADVEHLNEAIETRYGMRTTVLRSLFHGDEVGGVVERAHECAVHGGGAVSSELEWVRAATFASADAADGAALDAWRAFVGGSGRREWMSAGWYERACRWIETAMRTAGYASPLSIRQIRTWMSSCVLRVECDDGVAYFKAVPDASPEYAVTHWLGERFPGHVAPLVAADDERQWLLLGDCAGRNLETVTDIAGWAAAARRYGELQVECASRIGELRRAGCGDRALADLPDAVAKLAADAAALQPVDRDAKRAPGGLTDVELARLHAVVPTLAARCAELASFGIPNTLEHGDLWPGNVFVADAASAIIDWEDVAIAHPFLSLAPLTVGLGNFGLASAANVEHVERAYARAFESLLSPADLHRAFELAAPLCFFDMAVRYRAQRASVVRLHPWMRDLVPQTVRLALARV
jgi:hypothetical protein